MHFDKAYIIGIPKLSANRLDNCFKKFKEQDIDVSLWEGLHGLEINIEEYKKSGYLSDDFDLRLPGSLGCLLSHVTLWEKVNNDSSCEIALICEDDILLHKDFKNKLNNIPWEDVPRDWDIIKLSYHGLDGKEVSNNILRPNFNLTAGANSGTFCYLMKAKSAKKLRNILIPYNGKKSMDVLLRRNFKNFNPYLLKHRLATELRYKHSIRKELNYSSRKLKWFEKIYMKISKKLFS